MRTELQLTRMPKSVPDLPSAPAALGPYSPVVEANGFVFISGQIAADAAGDLEEDAGGQARQVMQQIGRMLGDLDLSYADVVKTTIFLSNMDDFAAVNEAYGSFFEVAPPARSTIEVARLPRDVAVEIETIATR